MMSDETFNKVRDETRKDPMLKELVEVVRRGWPVDKLMLLPCLRPFWSFKEEITVYKEVLVKSHQVITPSVLRKVELLPSVNFRNRLIVVKNRLISINRILIINLNMTCP